MLPTVKKTGLAALAALTISAVAAAPANAWGEKEQNFLAGVLATVAVGAIINDADKNDRAHAYQPTRPPAYQPDYRRAEPPRYQPYTGSMYQSAAGRAFQSFAAPERRAIQRRLARQGYYFGRIDGSFGRATFRAVEAYARDTGEARRLRSVQGAIAVYDSLIY